MHTIYDGCKANLPLLHELSRYVRCDEICAWLVKNKITGKTFLECIMIEHKKSVLSLVKSVLKRIDKDVTLRPIMGHKDYILK